MRLGILNGIHEDVVRLREAFLQIREWGCDKIVCLGDIVGFSPQYYGYPDTRDTHSVIELVRKNCKHVVVGNHDLFAIQKLPKDRTLFEYPADWYQKTLEKRKQEANGAVWLYDDESPISLGENDRAYLDSLPEFQILSIEAHRILLSHYAYPNLTGSRRI
jgi:predicted phosphodiesterase